MFDSQYGTTYFPSLSSHFSHLTLHLSLVLILIPSHTIAYSSILTLHYPLLTIHCSFQMHPLLTVNSSLLTSYSLLYTVSSTLLTCHCLVFSTYFSLHTLHCSLLISKWSHLTPHSSMLTTSDFSLLYSYQFKLFVIHSPH